MINKSFILFLLLSSFLFSCDKENKNAVSDVAYDPTTPNIVWRVAAETGITEEYDVINKKVLRTIPFQGKNSRHFTGSLLVTPKYVILDMIGEKILVYTKSDLTLFCNSDNIGKIIGEPEMKIASAMYASGTFMNESHFITITNERNVTKYFDFYNDKTLTSEDIEKLNMFIPLSRREFGALFQTNRVNGNAQQKYFNAVAIVQNYDYEAFSYKENILNDAETFIGMVARSVGEVWKIPTKSILKGNQIINRESIKNSRIIGDTLYLQIAYTGSYQRVAAKRASSESLFVIYAIDIKTGKTIWSYDSYDESTTKIYDGK